jgi:hypothetical protein
MPLPLLDPVVELVCEFLGSAVDIANFSATNRYLRFLQRIRIHMFFLRQLCHTVTPVTGRWQNRR